MSSIYHKEPPTNGRVLLQTTLGDIDIELWSKECPKACRNFLQLCMEGYYDNTIIHRVVKDFIAQGGDPDGTGCGGQSIWGRPFKDEFHSRLRFTRRGLVAMANSGPNDNASQFFFTLGPTEELFKRNTIFGTVVGNTIYNMIRLNELDTDHNERPINVPRILSASLISNPFDDLQPREKIKEVIKTVEEKLPKKVKKKNLKLLSFGDEAEVDEDELEEIINTEDKRKIKSSHDVLTDDPKLSSLPAYNRSNEGCGSGSGSTDNGVPLENVNSSHQKQSAIVREVISTGSDSNEPKRKRAEMLVDVAADVISTDDAQTSDLQTEIQNLKAELRRSKAKRNETRDHHQAGESSATGDYISGKQKYKNMKRNIEKGSSAREVRTMELLARFQSKIKETPRVKLVDVSSDEEVSSDEDVEDSSWLRHSMEFDEERRVEARDANVKGAETFDIYDPRNDMNKRRRKEHSRTKNRIK